MDSKKDDLDDLPENEGGGVPRARNRTVMLTPEMTGQLRSRMGREGLMPHDTQETMRPMEAEPPRQQEEYRAAPRPFRAVQPTPQQPMPSEGMLMQEELDGVRSSITPLSHRPPEPPLRTQPEAPKTGVFWSRLSPVVGFLVSYDSDENGEVFELRQGRIIVTCEKAGHGDYLVIADETISPMHAILRITPAGELQVLDQLSEFGTKIQRHGAEETEDLSGERSAVGHGDVLYFGKRSFHVCIVSRTRM